MATPRFRWEWLAGLFLMRFSAGLFFQWVAGAAEALRRELELDFAAIGALVGAFSLSGVAVTLLAGMVAQRFGDRRVLIGCFAVMAAGGAATVTADGFAGLFAGRFVAGIGGVAALTLLVKVTADHFAGPHLSTALATVMTSWPGGIAVGTVAWAWIADLHGWRAAAAGATGVILLALVAGLRILPPDVGGAVTRRLSWPTRTEAVLIAWAALAWAGFNGAMAVYVAFLPATLRGFGETGAVAALLAGSTGIAIAAAMPVGGRVSDRLGPRTIWFVVAALAIGTAAAMGVAADRATVALALVAGVAVGLPTGALGGLLAGPIPPERKSVAWGFFGAGSNLGIAGGAPLAGLARDISGAPGAPIAVAGLLMALTVVGYLGFRHALRARNA